MPVKTKPITYSIIIPAYNEEYWLRKILPRLKESLLNITDSGEIIVVDNNSTDQTAQVAKEHGALLLFEPINQISKARNLGAKFAQGRYLIFLDADTLPDPDLIYKALQNLKAQNCCGGGALLSFDKAENFIVNKIAAFFNFLIKKGKLAPGCFIYCPKEIFTAIGGFNEKIYASEEIWFSRNLKKWGKKHNKPFKVISDSKATTSGRKLNHPWRLILAIILGLIFPFMVYFPKLCWFWYKRPLEKNYDS